MKKQKRKIKKIIRKSYYTKKDKAEYVLIEYQKRAPSYKYIPS